MWHFSDIAPVIEGAVQHIASRRLELGGVDLTKLLAENLTKSNPMVKLKMSDVEKIKEEYACCADDDIAYEKMQQSCLEEEHTLPDGQVLLYFGFQMQMTSILYIEPNYPTNYAFDNPSSWKLKL